jgi:Uma2 family endonuclease
MPHALMAGWLAMYYAYTPGLKIFDNATCRLDDENEPQPDLALFKPAEIGGQARIDEEQYLVGGPELTVEVAASSVSYDAHVKKKIYQEFRVQEYVLWRVQDEAIDWFVLRDNAYVPATPDESGLVASTQFPGLVLDVPAMLRFDLATVLTRLQHAMASPTHVDFMKVLAGGKP